MSRTDEDFKRYVCDELRTLRTVVDANTALTEDIAAIVTMGKGMFKLAYRIGSILRWAGGVIGAVILFHQLFWDGIKGLFK
jgi:hypothetical protein